MVYDGRVRAATIGRFEFGALNGIVGVAGRRAIRYDPRSRATMRPVNNSVM